jgi:hypothetical protein
MKREYLGVVIISCVVALFFFRFIYPHPQLIITPDFGQSDAVWSFATKQILANSLKNHQILLWTSLIGGGYPIFAQGAMGTFYLPNLLFFSLLSPVYAYLSVLYLSICMTGWGMYFWLRLLGYRKLTSIFGAITLALSGYCIVQFTHIMIIQSFSLFPILAAITYKLAKETSWKITGVLAILLSQQILIGFPQTVFITMIFIVGYYLWLTRIEIADTIKFCIGLILGVGIAAIQLVPSMEYSSTLVSSGGFTPDIATAFSFPLRHLQTLVNPFALGNPANGTYPHFTQSGGSVFWENTIFIGFIPLICLLSSLLLLVYKKKPVKVTFFILALAGSFLLATGKYSPIYFLFSFWPFNIFRVPSRFIWIFVVALVILSSQAFQLCLTTIKQKRLGMLIGILAIVAQVFTVLYIWSPYHNIEPASEWLKPPTLSQYIDKKSYTLTIGGERLYANTYQNHGWATNDPNNRPSYIIRNTFTPDKNMLWEIPNIKDYAGREIRRSKVFDDLLDQTIITESSNATISAFGTKLLNLLSIKNVVSTLPLTQNGLKSIARLSDSTRDITLYTNSDAVPRIYITTQTLPVTTIEQSVETLMSDRFITGKTVLVENNEKGSSETNTTTITPVSASDGAYTVQTTSSEPDAILVLTELYYPGWHARIDGKETHIFPVNIKHIGVRLPQGNHTVTLRYQPESFVKGAWISLISLITTISLVLFL